MEQAFWLERWQRNEIGFHRDSCNHPLTTSWSWTGAPPGAEVLVPLCGKSRDMLWLRGRGYSVLERRASPTAGTNRAPAS